MAKILYAIDIKFYILKVKLSDVSATEKKCNQLFDAMQFRFVNVKEII